MAKSKSRPKPNRNVVERSKELITELKQFCKDKWAKILWPPDTEKCLVKVLLTAQLVISNWIIFAQ